MKVGLHSVRILAPETVEALKQTHPLKVQAVAGQGPAGDEPQRPDDDSEQATRLDAIERQTATASTAPSSRSGIDQEFNASILDKNQRQRQATRPHPEGGMSAQRWLFDSIEKWCLEHGMPQPRWEQDYIDITIPLDPPIFIEAKSIEKKTVHWTENQVRTAQGAKERYVVALLRLVGSNTDDYEVFWVTNPLEAFGNLPERHIKWTWQDQDGESFILQSWRPPEARPQRAATSFQAVISLDDHWIGKLTRGIESGMAVILANTGNEAVAEPPI